MIASNDSPKSFRTMNLLSGKAVSPSGFPTPSPLSLKAAPTPPACGTGFGSGFGAFGGACGAFAFGFFFAFRKVSQSYCDAVVKLGFDGVNHYNEAIVSLETERSKDNAPAPANSLLDQWTQERSAELAVYVDRLANAFGAPRNGTIFGGFSAFFRDVDLFLKRTPNATNKGYHKGKMCQEALTKPPERWRLMLRSPPPQKGAPAIVPRTFLHWTDPCFEQLRSRDQATEDLMKIDKLIPGALNAISRMASNPRSPGPPNPTPNPPPGGQVGGVTALLHRNGLLNPGAQHEAIFF